MLQYADDTIFLLEDNVESAQNLKFVLTMFEQMSGLKINFNKSEMFLFGGAKDREPVYSEIFGCKMGELPMKYLGFPIDEKRIRNIGWQKTEEKIVGRCQTWQGRLLDSGSRITLIQSALTGVPYYMMSFYTLPCGVRKRMDFYRARFLWQEDDNHRKYHLVN